MGQYIIDNNKLGRNKAILFLVITAVLWSTGGVLIKLVNWNAIAIAGTRSLIAALTILIFLHKPKFTWSFAQIGGAVSYSATVILFVCATKMTTAANAILLQYTAPVYVAVFGALLLKEKTKIYDWITIAVTFCGMAMFFVDKLQASGFMGNILAALAGVSFAFTAIFSRMQKDESPMVSIFLGNILTALIGLPFMFRSVPDTTGWIGLLLLGVFQLGIPYMLYSLAVKHVTALEVILIPVIEPLLNPVWVFLLVGETPGYWALVGGAIVVISVTIRCMLPVFQRAGAGKTSNHAEQSHGG